MNQFEQTIKQYLDERAQSDPQFAEKYANPKKSIEECCKYIIGWVKAQKREGYADAEIYGQAVHYYDEDNVKITKVQGAKVVVNHAIELSETEKREAREAARRRFEDAELKKLQEARSNAQKKRSAEPVATMADLFG
jgi:hypothetical protein